MSAFVSNVTSGNWSTLATWLQDGSAASRVPASGDTVTIRSGHDITLDVAATIGAGTGDALVIGDEASTGAVTGTTLDVGRTRLLLAAPLTCRGHVSNRGKHGEYQYIEMNAGQGIELDGDAGFQPLIYTNTGLGTQRFVFNGTQLQQCYIRTKSGKTEKARFTNLNSGVEDPDVGWSIAGSGQYVNFTDLGDSNYPGVRFKNPWCQDPASPHLALAHVHLFIASWAFEMGTGALAPGSDGGGYTLTDVDFTLTTAWNRSGVGLVGADFDGADALDLTDVGFDTTVRINHLGAVTRVVFAGGYLNTSSGSERIATSYNDVLVCTNGESVSLQISPGSYGRSHLVQTAVMDNPHLTGFGFTGSPGQSIAIDSWSFEAPIVQGGMDDTINAFGIPAGNSISITNAIVLPRMAGSQPGQNIDIGWFGHPSTPCGSVTIEHCTCWTGGSAMIHDDLGHSGQAGLLTSIRSNIFYRPSGSGYVFETQVPGNSGIQTDAADPANINHNCILNTTYNGTYTSGTPGANDLAVDPGFVDTTRNFITYYRTQVGTADPAYVAGETPERDLIKAINWMVVNSATVPAMIDWIRGGFAPTNAALTGAAHDGGTIGALAVESGSPTTVPTTLALSQTPNPGATGSPVSIRATITPATATGTVTFKEGDTTLGTATLSGGVASLDYTWSAPEDAHLITADYPGATGFLASSVTGWVDVVDGGVWRNTVGRAPVNLTEAKPVADGGQGLLCPTIHGSSMLWRGAWFREYCRRIDGDPLDPRSDEIMALLQGQKTFGSDTRPSDAIIALDAPCYWPENGIFYGAPYMVVDNTTPYTTCPGTAELTANGRQTITRAWMLPPEPISQESNPTDAYFIGGCPSDADYHLVVLVIDATTKAPIELWEYYNLSVTKDTNGNITALHVTSYRLYDLRGGEVPANAVGGVTAGGNPMMPLSFRPDELAAGVIPHCLRFTTNVVYMNNQYAWPAKDVSSGWTFGGLPEGIRLRVKDSSMARLQAAITDPQTRIVLQCLHDYGMILDDISGLGWDLRIAGSSDMTITDGNAMWTQIGNITASDLEVVKMPQPLVLTGPSSLTVGQQGTFTATSGFPDNEVYGSSLFWKKDAEIGSTAYGTDSGYDVGNVNGLSSTVTFNYAFDSPGTYQLAPYFPWYIPPQGNLVTVVDPNATATTYTVTFSGGATAGQPVTVTVTPNGTYTGTITLTPSGCGLSAPVTLSFNSSATAQTTTLTPTSAGTLSVTATSSPTLTNPTVATTTTAPANQPTAATTYTLTLTGGGGVGQAITATVTPNGTYTGSITLTPSGCGLTTPATLTFTGTSSAQTVAFTPTAGGTLTVTAASSPALTNPAAATKTVTATPAPATTYTVTLTGGGGVGQAVTATVTPNGFYTGTITLTPSGCGLTTPAPLTFSNSATAQTAPFTPTSAGTLTVTATSSPALTNPAAATKTITTTPPAPTGTCYVFSTVTQSVVLTPA